MVFNGKQFTLHLPEGFDDRSEWEMPARGYLSDAVVELSNGRKYAIAFYDPTRLQQELDLGAAHGINWVADPGLVVVPIVNRETILDVLTKLLDDGFFECQKPLSDSPIDTIMAKAG